MTRRLAVVISHPIQHFCPQYQSWASLTDLELKVFFASRYGLDAYKDENFARIVRWNELKLDFPHEFLPGATTRAIDSRIDCAELDTHLDNFHPSAIVIYGYSQPLQRRAAKWARRWNRPIIMVADSELRSDRSLLRRILKSIVLPASLKRVNYFLSVGDANEAYYRHYGVADGRLVRSFFPIDVRVFDKADQSRGHIRAFVRKAIEVPDDHIIVLMVGKLVSWKRQRDLVMFANDMSVRGRKITVVLAGSGPDETSLKEKAFVNGAGGVVFAGFVSPSELVGYYLASDIYAHCAEHEPHSLAISEAIYSGLPVVLSHRCGSYGPTDDVRPGQNGFVYTCGNHCELSTALTTLIENPGLRKGMSSESRLIGKTNQELAHGKALLQVLTLLQHP